MTESNSTASVIKGIGYVEIIAGVILGLVMFADYEAIVAIIIIIASFVSGVLLIGFGETIELLHQICERQKQLQTQQEVFKSKKPQETNIDEKKENKEYRKGTLNYQDGSSYDGELIGEEKNGYGKYKLLSGAEYVGEFKDDKMNGQGTMAWPNGAEYVGWWKDGMYHGQGTITYSNGKMQSGIWEKGVFKEK